MDIFQTPALYSGDLSPEEWQARISQMLNRAEATQQYRAGVLSPSDFEAILFEEGIRDPYELDILWGRGQLWDGQS